MKTKKIFRWTIGLGVLYALIFNVFASAATINVSLNGTSKFYTDSAVKMNSTVQAYVAPDYMISPYNSAIYVRVRRVSDQGIASDLGTITPDLLPKTLGYWAGFNVPNISMQLCLQNTVSGYGYVGGSWTP